MIGISPLTFNRGAYIQTNLVATQLTGRWPPLVQDGGIFTPNAVEEITDDFCTVTDHLTYNIVTDWTVTTGVFDPYELFDGTLKRNTVSDALVIQTLPTIQTGVNYCVSVSSSGFCNITFNSGNMSWSDGSTSNTKIFTSNGANSVSFSTAPTTISIRLTQNNSEIYNISMKQGTCANITGAELLANPSFENVESRLYDVETWYLDSQDPEEVPTNTLGWLEGYNTSQLFTIFE